MAAISLKNVNYQYPLEKQNVIENVSFEIDEGQVWGLIGGNESGKTTICNIIRGFIPQLYRGELSGTIQIKGKKVEDYDAGELASIVGYSFQNPFTQISGVKETVYEELAYGMENMGVPREEMIRKVEELLGMFHLEALADKNPFELSGGQKQRVALASMIALDPEIMILDEPTSQLDPKSTEDIFEVIRYLKNQGKTIVLVEHKIDLIAQYCDHVLLISDGKVAMQGTTQEVLTKPEVLQYKGQLPQVALYFLERLKRNGKEERIPLTVEEAYKILTKRGTNHALHGNEKCEF